MSELKPCPFCGGDQQADSANQHKSGCFFDVLASFRAAPDGDVSLAPDLAEAWNRRAIIDPPAQGEAVWRYFYKVADCPAQLASDVGCICWHAEGGGPLDATRGADTAHLQWRKQPAGEAVSVPKVLLARISDLLDGEWTISSYAECSYCGKQLGKDHQCELTDIERELRALLDGREG